ncbi:hypothetical protein ACFPTX_18520 [Pseudomonas sp. GCM10022188]|uniref:hypothetical protein n=1 Tax=Pseudomonas TaxID=286 RepID=UPI001E4687CD|nr:hypothetical protein [Pseudomonas oryzagri]MCC6076414.1 hypothetical protein [Pseudomonas oryzagri]
MLGLSIVVVLYRKQHGESSSLRSLIAALGEMRDAGFAPTIYVWNNSPGFTAPLEHEAVVWLEGENVKLPVIYNQVARSTFEAGGELLMISDDDTDYRQYDFRKNLGIVKEFLGDAQRRQSVGCFIPKILSGGRLVSPGGRQLFRGYLLDQVASGPISAHNLLAINSATLITRDCYERMQPLYDERLNFYGTDTEFFVRYEEFYSRIYVFDSQIDHSLSADSKESPDRMLFRWRDNIRAMNVIFERTSFPFKLAMRAYYLLMKVKLAVRFRDKRFLQI